MGWYTELNWTAKVTRLGLILVIIAISVVFPAFHTHAGEDLFDLPGEIPQHEHHQAPVDPDHHGHDHDHHHHQAADPLPSNHTHSHPDHYHQQVDFELTRILTGSTHLSSPLLTLVGRVTIPSDTRPRHSLRAVLSNELTPRQVDRDSFASRAPPLS